MLENTERRTHLGSGWRFPIALDDHGRVEISSLERKVEESIGQSAWCLRDIGT